ncbi:MAG TPA: polysaccharide biosynthesis tyrosine autokinase [Ignavibacteria bacterium]|nr:polysaccharide biosynthesis tyrosine autokinase [Ignavibacteria bacterium]HRJ98479.1 polysaccharide biosynthesis tyrosine autokinase [Ignavibacteria bacterium]
MAKNNSFDEFDEFEQSGEAAPSKDVLKEYINVLRQNLIPILIILSVSIIYTLIYVNTATNIYRSTTSVKLDSPQGNILTANFGFEGGNTTNEKYIQVQIAVMKSYDIRDRVSKVLIDSFNTGNRQYSLLLNRAVLPETVAVSHEVLRRELGSIVTIASVKGLDAISITAEGPIFDELQYITKTYADVYLKYNVDLSRQDITNVKKFIVDEREKKFKELNDAENSIENFQKKTGYISLSTQTSALVNNIAQYEALIKGNEIETRIRENSLNSLNEKYADMDPQLTDFIEAQLNQSYLTAIQSQVANLEVQRDIELAPIRDEQVKEKTREVYDRKLNNLKEKLSEQIEIMKTGIQASTPAEKKSLSSDIFNQKLQIQDLKLKNSYYQDLVNKSQNELKNLPEQMSELVKLERDRSSAEKLYTTLEQKYQEATINERARVGNASILDLGLDNNAPVAPDRPKIILFGILIGLGLGLAFAFVRNYLDKSIKSPDELESKGASVLSWIPKIETIGKNGTSTPEFIVGNKSNSAASEAFKALRTRIQFSRLESEQLKTILVTSSIPFEGKTIVSSNLAGSFAQAGKKVLIMDCDLRKPRIHNVFETDKFPGLSDYLFTNVTLEDITRPTPMDNLHFITSGTIPPNPSELLGSVQMKQFINKLKEIYDIVIIDSPPFITVTDSEILYNITDGTVLVCQANKTPADAFWKTYDRLNKKYPHHLLGCVLNNFNFKSSYGYYYNYYYYYSQPDSNKKILK